MSCIFAKRSVCENTMSENNDMCYIVIVALKNILEVCEFECGIDIEWD